MNSRRRSIDAVLACVFAVLCAACGGEQPPAVTVTQAQPSTAQPAAASPQPSAAQTTPATSTAAPSAPAPTAAPAASTPAASAPSPIAVEDHQVAGVQVALMELRRTSGDTVTLRVQFRNTTDKDVSDGLFYGSSIATRTYLIDGASKKKYLVVEDAESKPVAYIGESSTIKARGTIPAWVRFPAPPAETTTVTVVVPGVPPFEDVPIK